MLELHYLKDYRRLISVLKTRKASEAEAMEAAVGGSFDAMGQIELDLLRMHGLSDGMRLVDVGCGSGRLAIPLSKAMRVGYHGLDVVPDLVDYARRHTPEDYRFSVVENIEIPVDDESVDFACAFSVFTHLLHEESYIYLDEMRRVLKPGGKAVFSFLEFRIRAHWTIFANTVTQVRNGHRQHLNVFMDRAGIQAMADDLGLKVVDWMDSEEGNVIPLARPVTTDKGRVFVDKASMGQSVCIMQK
jgi:ubiquinone/menaquinone biosynthesis C-methylase UbiE